MEKTLKMCPQSVNEMINNSFLWSIQTTDYENRSQHELEELDHKKKITIRKCMKRCRTEKERKVIIGLCGMGPRQACCTEKVLGKLAKMKHHHKVIHYLDCAESRSTIDLGDKVDSSPGQFYEATVRKSMVVWCA